MTAPASSPPSSSSGRNGAPPVEAPQSRSPASRLAGAVLLAFLAGGLLSTLAAVVSQRLDLAPHPLTRPAFLEGASMRDMAAALAQAPLARWAAQKEREGSWLAVRDLGPQVRQGCPGWLFLAEEFTPQVDADARLRDRAHAVVALRDRLQARGIRLVVAVVPDKSRIEAARRCGLERSPAIDNRLRVWAGRLSAADVPLVDTTAVLQGMVEGREDPFLRTDSHWTEAGADAAARAVADAVRSRGIELSPHQDYEVGSGPVERRPGDLVRLAGIDGLPPGLQPASEFAVDSRFTALKSDSSGATAASAEDELFGDSELPQVALIGTSFSRTSHFAEFLAAALQTPVGNFAKDGGNFWGAAGAYFSSDAFRQTPPKLVIWEIPERVLQLPRGGEIWALP